MNVQDDVTVIIPVYNQAEALSLTLEGFAGQTPPFQHSRIVVMDDGSTQPIRAVVEAFKDKLRIDYVRISRSGRAVARNLGSSRAEKGLLVFCDADRIPAPDFLAAHYDAHQRAPVGQKRVVIGQVRETYLSDPTKNRQRVDVYLRQQKHQRIPQYCQLVYRLFDSRGQTASPICWIATFSGNMSLSVEGFRQLGGFDENFREWGFEHFELGYRAYRQKFSFVYEPQASNVHLAHRREGFSYEEKIRASHAYFLQKHPDPAIESFLPFMLGKLSMNQLEQLAAYGSVVQQEDHASLYVRITNF
ncbi:glycosyltransferase family 2 protein [Brevibacillus fulvus]|uniref:Glycosyltransferase involved in cell wall biosynthesis n=1 Tax=Brevibacillus fulvus TaxID=1125967 RepID=A0A938XZD2_9BACL|nr:glycosyltransferase [Brevibacillus fulvus]MBM7589679.1 glycosyltransferase involved in cell wall biosynthesis [Brevibacillus fulvus]